MKSEIDKLIEQAHACSSDYHGVVAALACWKKIIGIDQNHVDAHFYAGLRSIELMEYNEAIKHLDKAMEIEPERFAGGANYHKAHALAWSGRPNEAVDAYNKSIASNPDFMSSYYDKVSLLVSLKRYEEAAVCYDQMIVKVPNDVDLYIAKSGVCHELVRYDEAIDAYCKACALDSTRDHSYYEATVFFNNGNYHRALELYKENNFFKQNPSPTFFLKRAQDINDIANRIQSSIKIPTYQAALSFVDEALCIHNTSIKALTLKFDIFRNISQVMMEAKNYDKALEYLKLAENLDPDRLIDIKKLKGEILLKQGKFDEALGCFAESNSGYTEAMIGKLKGYEEKIKNDYRDELYDQVLGDLTKYFRLHGHYNSEPGWPEVNPGIVKIKGSILIKQGKYEEALQYFVEGDIGYKEAKEALLKENVNKANDSFRQGDYVESLKAYTKSLEVSPNDEACRFGLYASKGYLLIQDHKYVEARENFIKALEVRPNKEISITAAECGLILKDYENVLKILEGLPVDEKVKQLKSLSYNEVGIAHYNKEEYADAVKFYKLAVEINPKEITHKNNLGAALIASGEFEEAIKYLESQEDKAIAFNMLGNSFYEKGNYSEAIRCFKKANELSSDVSYVNNIGYSYLMLRNVIEAKKYFEEVLSSRNDDERALQGKELTLKALIKNAQSGSVDKMLRYYDELIGTSQLLYSNPNPEYLFEKARLLAEVTQHKEAIKFLEQAINIDKDYGEAVELMQQLNCIVGNIAVIERHGDNLGEDEITNKFVGADSLKIGGNYDDEL